MGKSYLEQQKIGCCDDPWSFTSRKDMAYEKDKMSTR